MGDYSTPLVESAFILRVFNYTVRQFHKTLWKDELEIMWQKGSQIAPLSQNLAL
jgi:hypothetical protein